MTLRYLAYEARPNEVQVSLRRLDELDGISDRRAHEVHPHLEEMGLMLVARNKNPHNYVQLLPTEWKVPVRRHASHARGRNLELIRVEAPPR